MRGHCSRQLNPSAGPQCCITHFVFTSTLQILHKIQHWGENPVTFPWKVKSFEQKYQYLPAHITSSAVLKADVPVGLVSLICDIVISIYRIQQTDDSVDSFKIYQSLSTRKQIFVKTFLHEQGSH